MDYSIDDKIACISRELGMRQRVYKRQVQEGKMDLAMAEKEVGIMARILTDYIKEKDSAQLSLFTDER